MQSHLPAFGLRKPLTRVSAFLFPRVFRQVAGIFLTSAESTTQKRATARHLPGGDLVEHKFDRRSFLRVAGTSLSIGALYSVFPALTRSAGAETITRTLAQLNGEAPAPFSFIQLSDTHVGFNGPPDPLVHQGIRERSRHNQRTEKSPRAGHRHRRFDPRRRLYRRARKTLKAVQTDFVQNWRRSNQARAGRE